MPLERPVKPKVLVVEDNPTNLKLLRGILGKLDCDIIETRNGRTALAAIHDHHFAAILLDIHLPDMDGFKVAESLSEDSRKRETPLIFVTAEYTDDMSRLNGYKLGAVDYITKPVDPFILQSKISVFLELYDNRQGQQQLHQLLHRRNRELEREIRERQKAEENARHQANHDPLTDLPNRLLFMDRLHTAIARAKREGSQMGLIYIDIDRFKPVNDEYGHHAGDELLQQIAQRLAAALREADTVARLGGDEFAVVLEQIHDRENAMQIMEKLHQTLDTPFVVHPVEGGDEVVVDIGGSLGLAIYPDDGDEEEALLRHADAQMYTMKKAHKRR